jgi:hypothetical protein
MNPINLFDSLFGLALVGAILLGIMRGNGRETLHTFLFGLSLLAGWLFLRSGELPTTQVELARLAVGIGFYSLAMYVFCWALMGILAPFMLDGIPAGIRSRFWAGAQAICKLMLVILGINLWYATHSSAPVWERLQPLPPLLRGSTFIALSDRVTDDTHRWLAAQNFLTYQYTSGTVPAPSWETSPTTALTPMEVASPTAPAPAGQPEPLLPEETL